MRRRARALVSLVAVALIAVTSTLLLSGRGEAQTGGGVAPDLTPVVRKISNGKPSKFGDSVKAKVGDLVQFRIIVANYKSVGGAKIGLALDRGPAKSLSASASSGGGASKRVSITSSTGDAIALGTLRFNCVAPPTFCPVKFRKPGDQWRGSYTAPATNDFAIFSATVVKPADRP
ncbi:MAG: hypothetical protein QOF76_2513 [Solirubrobacteraceae bacterium]|jgi:hypothetical protein|nr:hypothetical protein [Solirubrobacteraceae bacterium]